MKSNENLYVYRTADKKIYTIEWMLNYNFRVEYLQYVCYMIKKTTSNYSYNDCVTVPLIGNVRKDSGSSHYND